MLLRCCSATLLLLVAGCAAQCLNDTYDDCLEPWCTVYSDEDGQRYITRLTLETFVEEKDDKHEYDYGNEYTNDTEYEYDYDYDYGNETEYEYDYDYEHENVTSASGFTSCTAKTDGTVVSRVDATFEWPKRLVLRELHKRTDSSWMTKSPFVQDFWLGSRAWPDVIHLSVHMYNMSVNQTYVSNLPTHSLVELELTGNSWTTASGLSLNLMFLKKLSLSGNQIEFLHEGLLDRCSNLEVLDLSRNKIEDIHTLFLHLSPLKQSLNYLNLANNFIRYFDDRLWDMTWRYLKKVDLSYNMLESFRLTGNRKNSEVEVDMSFNKLAIHYRRIRVDRVILAGQNISALSEVGRILSKIAPEVFEHSLRYVEISYDELSGRYVTHIPQSECTAYRKYMYCKANVSSVFPTRKALFVNFTGNALYFSRYSVPHIWPKILVDLSENRLKVIKSIPAKISGTRELNLSRNSIRYISERLFQNMTRLTILDLSHNLLKHVQLILYSSLHMLDISNNYLNRMNISHKSSKYTIEYLNLSHNSFTNIREAEWSQFKQFSKVDLGENNLKCCGPEEQYSRAMFVFFRHNILNINSNKPLTCEMAPYERVEMTYTWLREDHCQKKDIRGWVGVGCLLLLFPLLMHGVDLLDYFIHQTERDLAEQLTRLKKQGLEQDENCALECDYDAFVCHSHKDAGWVTHELVPNLENDRDGHRLCIHYRNFPLGSLIEENVEKAINKSRKVIVVVTRSFLDSYWCKMELTYAWLKMLRERRNFIIVIEVDRIPEDKRPPILAYLMHSRTYLEWPEAPSDDVKKNCWRRVRDALGKSLRDRHEESGTAVIQMDCEDLQNI